MAGRVACSSHKYIVSPTPPFRSTWAKTITSVHNCQGLTGAVKRWGIGATPTRVCTTGLAGSTSVGNQVSEAARPVARRLAEIRPGAGEAFRKRQ